MKSVSLNKASTVLGVSNATIRNWVKAGHLAPCSTRPLTFLDHEVVRLKEAIGSGELGRLRKRANKTNSSSLILPKEYIENDKFSFTLQRILSISKSSKLKTSEAMFYVSLRILEIHGEVENNNTNSLLDFSLFQNWSRRTIQTEMSNWYSEIAKDGSTAARIEIFNSIYITVNSDFLGLVYQCLSIEGDKSNTGAYYTPSAIISESFTDQYFTGKNFLDPCCGTGNYLLHAYKLLNVSIENIFGFDIDPIAVRIARLNLLLLAPDYDSPPNVFCMDSLQELANGSLICKTNHLLSGIDFVATNPPWGAHKNHSHKSTKKLDINSNEVFSLFLLKSIELLRFGGILSFILPESFLKIKTHRDIRKFILGRTKIVRIVTLGRQFSGVFTGVLRLDLVKDRPSVDWELEVVAGDSSVSIPQQRFLNNEDYSFDINVSGVDEQLLTKLFSVNHQTLYKKAEWALGIVTGANAKHVFNEQFQGMEGIVRGSDISKFAIQKPQKYLHFDPALYQQVARESMYRAPEKLIYKFISSKLAFAYDNCKRLTLNSANILIPNIPEYTIKSTLAMLNSDVFQFIFQKRFSTHKVLRGDLEKLPFPNIKPEDHMVLESFVDAIHAGHDKIDELNNFVFQIFGLSSEEISRIRLELNGSNNGKA